MAIVKILKLEGASIPWTVKQIAKMYKQSKINTKNPIQRSYVWEIARRSELIWSTVMGYPIPPLYAKRDDESGKVKIYDIMDGQQRIITFVLFINDEFALGELKPILYLDENGEEQSIDISGLKFSELDEEIQDAIQDRTLSVFYYDNLEQAEQAEMFRRLNNGKPLSTKARTLASCQDILGILDIGTHKLFQPTDGMLTEKARTNKNQVALVMKCWCMMNMDVENISFESKVFNPLMERTTISETEKMALNEVFNLIFDTHFNLIERKEKKVAKKLYTETHMVSLIPFFKKAVENGIGEDMMADWLVEFFTSEDGASVSENYNNACSGSAKGISINCRNDELQKSWDEFFKVDDVVEKDALTEKSDDAATEEVMEEMDAQEDTDSRETMGFAESIMADMESENE